MWQIAPIPDTAYQAARCAAPFIASVATRSPGRMPAAMSALDSRAAWARTAA